MGPGYACEEGRDGQGQATRPFGHEKRWAQHRGRSARASRTKADGGRLRERLDVRYQLISSARTL
jgi:hypothetical protein